MKTIIAITITHDEDIDADDLRMFVYEQMSVSLERVDNVTDLEVTVEDQQ